MNNLKSLKASNSRALLSLLLPFVIGVGGVICVLQEMIAVQVLGHLMLSIFFLQTFILLHECGHLNFFSSRWANVWVGRLMGLLTLIPFYTWKEMHNLHHRWTGWRDLDPTTSGTVGPGASKTKNAIVNICWKLFVPVFYLGYKIGNYWWLPKMSRFLPESKYKKARVSVIAYGISYVLLGWFFGREVLHLFVPGFLLSLLWKELVIMTQHSHVEMPVSQGEEVKPISFQDQIPYTRSFFFNKTLAKWMLLNFNLHEAHHAKPGVPAYYLTEVPTGTPEKPSFGHWFQKAKGMQGVTYVFTTSAKSGKYLE